jgi:hypothetical protein
MIREERTVFLTALTFIVYAAIQWIEKGIFLFPFPLNELGLLGVFLYIMITNKSTRIYSFFVYGTILIFKLLSQQFVWSLFLPPEILEVFFDSLWTDIFYICYGLSFVWFTFLFCRIKKSIPDVIIFCLISSSFMVGLLLNQPIFELLSLVSIILYGYRFKIDRILQAQLTLFFILEMGKQLMLIY